MSNNIFSGKRFSLLCKQHIIHNTQALLLSTVAYIGAIFIVLSVAQVSNNLHPHDLDHFQGFLIGFVAIFGVLYVGHSFPAFRSKESTINYLMIPASVLEKFVFEFISRIGLMILLLPLIYWITFHFQGYFFTIFTEESFNPIGIQYLIKFDIPDPEYQILIYVVASTAVTLAFVLAFTGSAMFSKQPLVKSVFAAASIVIFFIGYSYIVLEHLGVEKYNPPDNMWLIPLDEANALKFVSIALFVGIVVMLFVAYRKLKEREV